MSVNLARLAGSVLVAAALTLSVPGIRNASAQTGTTLVVTNNTSSDVPVLITLGAGYGIANVNQLPADWNVSVQAPLKGMFTLGASRSVHFNSGTRSFSGNIAFGPTFTAMGCGSTAANSCYPNATNLAEFTLNMPGETVDLSGVNGTNAMIVVNFKNGPGDSRWNDGEGGNRNVRMISNQAISGWQPVPGVYGWQGTNCTFSYQPPNPMANCPSPKNAPTASQLQTRAQCNIQRQEYAPTGGVVQIVFTGWAAGSQPPANCQ